MRPIHNGIAIDLKRVVVAVDPSGTKGDGKGVEIGIVVAGLGTDERGYRLADLTCQLSPDGWARRAIDAVATYQADRIVAERNFGGAMVEAVIRAADKNAPFKEVTASGGKVARAEPVAALYEQGKVSHVGGLSGAGGPDDGHDGGGIHWAVLPGSSRCAGMGVDRADAGAAVPVQSGRILRN